MVEASDNLGGLSENLADGVQVLSDNLRDSMENFDGEPVVFTEEELDLIARTIFYSDEGWVNNAVKFYSGRDELEDYQKVLLAPANAFESLVQFGVSLFDSQTYSDMASLVGSVSDPAQREALKNLLARGWENCSREEKEAFVFELICTVGFSTAAFLQLKKVLPASKLAALTQYASTQRLAQLGQAIVASPLDDIAVAVTPALSQMQQNPPISDI